jgi:hypothetical protein
VDPTWSPIVTHLNACMHAVQKAENCASKQIMSLGAAALVLVSPAVLDAGNAQALSYQERVAALERRKESLSEAYALSSVVVQTSEHL